MWPTCSCSLATRNQAQRSLFSRPRIRCHTSTTSSSGISFISLRSAHRPQRGPARPSYSTCPVQDGGSGPVVVCSIYRIVGLLRGIFYRSPGQGRADQSSCKVTVLTLPFLRVPGVAKRWADIDLCEELRKVFLTITRPRRYTTVHCAPHVLATSGVWRSFE